MENIETLQVGLQFKINNAKEIEGQAQDLVSKLSGSSVSMTRMSSEAKNVSTGLNKAVSTAKKFAFALLSVRGVWFAIRKSMTMYLAQNEELQNKLNSLYYAVGSMFAPLLEGLVNILAKAVSFINAIVKAMGFAGIDMSNFNKNAQGASKALQKSLLAIDEINNLQDKDSGGGVVMPTLDFESVKLPKWLEKLMGGIGGYLKTTLHGITKLIMDEPLTSKELEHTILTGLGLVGIGTAVMTVDPAKGFVISLAGLLLITTSMFNSLKYKTVLSEEDFKKILLGSLGLIGTGVIAGALGYTAAGILLPLTGLIVIDWAVDSKTGNVADSVAGALKSAIATEDLDRETKDLFNNIANTSDSMWNQITGTIPTKMTDVLNRFDVEQFRNLFNTLGVESSDSLIEGIKSGALTKQDAFKLALIEAGWGTKDSVEEVYGELGSDYAIALADSYITEIENRTGETEEATSSIVDNLGEAAEQVDLSNISNELDIADGSMLTYISNTVENKDKVLKAWGEIKDGIVGVWVEIETQIKTSTNNILTTVGNMFNGIVQEFNSMADEINSLGDEQKSFMGIGFKAKHMNEIVIPQYAVGTNYVPNDQLAYLHKGEAVIPKKFNSSEFFGESSAEELNLLSSINEQLIELNRKDTTINLDSENVARVVSNAQQRLTQRNGNRVFALNR